MLSERVFILHLLSGVRERLYTLLTNQIGMYSIPKFKKMIRKNIYSKILALVLPMQVAFSENSIAINGGDEYGFS